MKKDFTKKNFVGHIIEVPAHSPVYHQTPPIFKSLEEELYWRSTTPKYTLFDGALIGGHYGLENYHLGQRKGLQISGKSSPIYVIAKDTIENRLFVGAGNNHPGLFREVLFFNNNQFIALSNLDNNTSSSIETRINLDHEIIDVNVLFTKEGIYIDFKKKVSIQLLEKEFEIFDQHNVPIIQIKQTK